MQSRRSWRVRNLALAWSVAFVLTLAVNPAAQAGTTGALEAKHTIGGPVPARGEETISTTAKSKKAEPAAGSQKATQPHGDPALLVLDAWVWRCDPTALVAAWSPKALCEDFVALR